MAILYGTTGDGTTLPVLVDQFGNLLAKGIKGDPGQPGEPGPPGVGELPPDPYEGAILGWEDGELAWVGGSVPLPAGTYGPYTYEDGSEQLNIPQDASSLVNGQSLYMSDLNGNEVSAIYKTNTISKVALQPSPETEVGAPIAKQDDVFASSLKYPQYSRWCEGKYVIYRFSEPLNGEIRLGIRARGSVTNIVEVSSDGGINYNIAYSDQPVNNNVEFQDGGKWWIISLGTRSNINWIKLSLSDGDDAQSGSVSIGNTLITDSNNGGGQQLSIESSENFDKFHEGQKVQEPDAYITEIDALGTPPMITVRGGLWRGADGSGDLNGQTVITSDKSGSGSVAVGVNGAIILRANNKEWVDDFYVTAPEQRIAARKVASAAIRRKTT